MPSPISNIVFDCADPMALAEFWATAVGYQKAHMAPYFSVLAPPAEGDGPRLFFQQVPEAKAGKNRVHVDLDLGDMAAAVERLSGLGARTIRAYAEHNFTWTVMADPEGNEFCVSGGPITADGPGS